MPEQPYETERQASTAARARITPLPGEVILTRAQRVQLLTDALEAAGVPLGPVGDRLVKWLSNYEDEWVEQVCQWVRMAAARASAVRLLEEVHHLRVNGEYAPGGTENWPDLDRRIEEYLRSLLPPEREDEEHG